MKSLKAHYKKISEKNPYYSSYISFALAVAGKKFTRPMISRWFTVLVDKDDYCSSDRRMLIEHMHLLSNPSEDDGKQTKF